MQITLLTNHFLLLFEIILDALIVNQVLVHYRLQHAIHNLNTVRFFQSFLMFKKQRVVKPLQWLLNRAFNQWLGLNRIFIRRFRMSNCWMLGLLLNLLLLIYLRNFKIQLPLKRLRVFLILNNRFLQNLILQPYNIRLLNFLPIRRFFLSLHNDTNFIQNLEKRDLVSFYDEIKLDE